MIHSAISLDLSFKLKMKRILIILLCIWQGAGAQEILVPYKTGNRWGLADLQGKLVVPTNYDWISIGKDYPGGYFGFKIPRMG